MEPQGGENGDVPTTAISTPGDDVALTGIAVSDELQRTQTMPSTVPASETDSVARDELPDTVEDDPAATIDYAAAPRQNAEASTTDGTERSSDGLNELGPLSPQPGRDSGQNLRKEHVAGYQLLAMLGHGGMGVVYKARHLGLNRLVALKMIRDASQTNAEILERFRVEAEVVARLRHPNILQIYEIGTARGCPFVAFELLEGGSLARRLGGTPQPDREAANLLTILARAVHAAHQAGVVHRDLKPSNVLYDRSGVPKITDFGLAKRLEVDEGQTRSGQVMGTPSYMAPEQAEGRIRAIGPATDVYALGAVLYELLTGRPPFKGETSAETLKLVLTEEILPPSRLRPKIPRDLETICLKCLEREPQKRYSTAVGLADDLERYVNRVPILARRTPAWERAWKWARRHPAATLLIALCCAASVGLFAMQQRAADRARSAAQREDDRLARLRGEVEDALFKARDALADRRWDEARELTIDPLNRVQGEARLADLAARAANLRDEAQRGRDAQKEAAQLQARYRRFMEQRDETLFLDTRFTALDTTVHPEATRRAAEAALGVFMTPGPGGTWRLPPLPAGLSSQQQADIEGGCYELLVILADAVAKSAGADRRQRADEALRILEQATSLRFAPTRAYHWRRAEYLEIKGDTEAASRARKQADALAPAGAFDRFLSGRECVQRGDWEPAIADLNAVLQQQPDHFWAQCLLAVAYMQLHEPLKARPSLNACLQRRRDAVWLYVLRGLANAQVGELALDAALRFPERRNNLNAEATAQFEAAEADYRTAFDLLDKRPDTDDLRYVLLVNRGQFRLQRGKLQDAEADLRAAAQRDERRYEAPSALGLLFKKQGRTAEALQQCGRALALRPGWSPLYRERAEILLELKALTSEQRAAALADLEDAIRFESSANPELIAADRTHQARLLHQEGRDEDALDACAAALAMVPGHTGAHRLRIQVLLALKRYDNLIASCDVAFQSGKPSADLYELRGMAYDALGQHSAAINDYTMALNLLPKTPRVLVRRGWSYLIQSAAGPALDDFDAALELDGQNADAYNGRGMARARLGSHREAVRDAEQALRQGTTDDWRTPYNAARVYAVAAVAAAADARKQGPRALAAVARHQDRALELIRVSLERKSPEQRAAFLRDTVQNDPAFSPLKRRLRSLETNLVPLQSRLPPRG